MTEAARVVQLSDRTRSPYGKTTRRTKSRKATDTGEKQLRATRISDIPRAQLACRVKHRWPMDEDLEMDGPLPRGVTVVLQSDGTKRLTEKCKRRGCPRHRSQETLPGGIYDPHAPYLYDQPQSWVIADASLGMSPRVAKGAMMGGRVL